jgi:Glycosyltransferase family 87
MEWCIILTMTSVVRLRAFFTRARLVGAGVFISAVLLVLGIWSVSITQPFNRCRIDLQPTFLAGRLWAAGESGSIYQPGVFVMKDHADPAWVAASLRHVGGPPCETTFVYSPWYIVLTAPLTNTLSLDEFVTLWLVLNAVCTAWIGWESVAWAGGEERWKRFVGAVLAGSLITAMYGAFLGQNVAICLALVMAGVRLATGGMRGQVGGGVAFLLAALCKPWAILLIPVLGLSRRWVALAVAGIGTLMLMLGAQSPIFPAEMREDYVAMNCNLVSTTNVAFNNVAARAFLHRVTEPGWGVRIASWSPQTAEPGLRPVELGIVAGVALLAAWPVWRKRGDLRLITAAALPLVLVPLGICWTHYLLLLVPGLWMLIFRRNGIIPGVLAAGILMLLALLPFHPVPLRFQPAIISPRPAEVAEHPLVWSCWYLLPLLMGLGISILLLGRPDAAPPDSGRSNTR